MLHRGPVPVWHGVLPVTILRCTCIEAVVFCRKPMHAKHVQRSFLRQRKIGHGILREKVGQVDGKVRHGVRVSKDWVRDQVADDQ